MPLWISIHYMNCGFWVAVLRYSHPFTPLKQIIFAFVFFGCCPLNLAKCKIISIIKSKTKHFYVDRNEEKCVRKIDEKEKYIADNLFLFCVQRFLYKENRRWMNCAFLWNFVNVSFRTNLSQIQFESIRFREIDQWTDLNELSSHSINEYEIL